MTSTSRSPVLVVPVEGVPEVRPGDDLAAVLAAPLRAAGARAGDVVVVTSKVVSKAEGRIVRGVGRADAVIAETSRVVARRGDLVIAETAHGFVCANAGVDASNVEAGSLALLPEDPDASARRLRSRLSATLGLGDLAVVVTDTFGRAWRTGVVNVAIGCDGLPAIVDLRGRADDRGRTLEATEIALADEVAAASGLVIAKDSRIPVAIVRGVDHLGGKDGSALDLVRPAEEDLFRVSPMQALHDRRTSDAFGPGDVPRTSVEEAIAAACAAALSHDPGPLRFTVLNSGAARRGFRAAMAACRSAPAGGHDEPAAARALGREDEILAAAPLLIVPWLRLGGTDSSPEAAEPDAELMTLLLSGGAVIQSLLLALSAQGLAGGWVGSPLSCPELARDALGVDRGWLPLGAVAGGPTPTHPDPRVRQTIDPGEVSDWR